MSIRIIWTFRSVIKISDVVSLKELAIEITIGNIVISHCTVVFGVFHITGVDPSHDVNMAIIHGFHTYAEVRIGRLFCPSFGFPSLSFIATERIVSSAISGGNGHSKCESNAFHLSSVL
jgi:hypothetical protein